MLENFDVIVIFLICGQFGAIRKLDSRRIVCKTYFFINKSLEVFKSIDLFWKKLLPKNYSYAKFMLLGSKV